jgi:hypothetical protein
LYPRVVRLVRFMGPEWWGYLEEISEKSWVWARPIVVVNGELKGKRDEKVFHHDCLSSLQNSLALLCSASALEKKKEAPRRPAVLALSVLTTRVRPRYLLLP